MLTRLRAFLYRWSEAWFWLPLAVLLTFGAWYGVRYIDARAGADPSELFMVVTLSVRAFFICFFAWFVKHTYLWEPNREDERMLHDSVRRNGETAVGPRFLLLKDRAEWLFLLAFWGWFFSP